MKLNYYVLYLQHLWIFEGNEQRGELRDSSEKVYENSFHRKLYLNKETVMSAVDLIGDRMFSVLCYKVGGMTLL